MPPNNIIQLRKGTSTEWTNANPVLASGEPGYDTTNNILKIGDGATSWSGLGNHKHSYIDITDFNSGVSGLLPVTSISGGTNINVSSSGSIYTIDYDGPVNIKGYEVLESSKTVFTVSEGYVVDHLHVFLNGVKLLNTIDYTATNGTSFTLNQTAVSGDVVEWMGLSGYDTYIPIALEQIDDRINTLLVAGTGISLNYDDNANTLTISSTGGGGGGGSGADEIEEYATTTNFPASGDLNILYIATDTGQIYKWDGEFYYENGPQGASTGSHSDQHASDGNDNIPLREYIVPSFASNTNNLAHNNKDILYISGDANNRELSGLVASSGCSIKLLVNTDSSNTIILKHQSTNSDPSNRFLIYTGADYYLLPGYSVSILYDTNASRWRVL